MFAPLFAGATQATVMELLLWLETVGAKGASGTVAQRMLVD
jgi:hypothetical protein